MSPSSRRRVEEGVVKFHYYCTYVAWHMYHDYARNYFSQRCSRAVSVDQCTASCYALFFISTELCVSARGGVKRDFARSGTWHQPAKAGLCSHAWQLRQ